MKIIIEKSWDEIGKKWIYASYKKDFLMGRRLCITIGYTEEECIERTKQALAHKKEQKTIDIKS